MDAEVVDDARLDGVLAAPEAEAVPGDLRRTPDEEVEAPDVRVFVVARRGSEEDGAPPLREAPEPKDIRAMSARLGYASPFERLVVHWRQGTLVRRAVTAAALLLGAAWLARGFARRNTN